MSMHRYWRLAASALHAARRCRAPRGAAGSILIGALLAVLPAGAQSPGGVPVAAVDTRPTVAVFDFTNGALVDHAEYGPLTRSMADLLGETLSRNSAIRVVERDRLYPLLAEQDLGASGRVDVGTAVRIGHLLGVHHLLLGTFVIQPKDRRLRISVHSVNAETGQWEYVQSVENSADRLFALIDELGVKINAGLQLPQLPTAPASPGSRTGPPAETPSGTPSGPLAGVRVAGRRDWLQAMIILGQAITEEDRGHVQEAIAKYRQALSLYPDFDRAKVRLASIEIGREGRGMP